MQNHVQDKPKTWRDHWLIKNILAEIPLIGSFFAKKTYQEALHDAGKCMSALAGGTTTMMYLWSPLETDNMQIKFLKMTSSMAIGMTAGKSIYNSLYSCSSQLLFRYRTISRQSNAFSPIELSDDLESQARDLSETSTAVNNQMPHR